MSARSQGATMRIAHLADITAVMHIQSNDEVIVAVPADLSKQDILYLASLVLSSQEYDQVASELPNDAAPR